MTEEDIAKLIPIEPGASEEKQFKWVLGQISTEKLDGLLAALSAEERPEPADVAAIIKAAMEVSRKTAGAKKRGLLKNALVNSFDPKQYQEGLTVRLFSILQEIEYGDVELLRRVSDAPEGLGTAVLSNDSGSIVYHHLELLDKLGLVVLWNHSPDLPLGLSSTAHTKISELGMKFLGFIAEPDTL